MPSDVLRGEVENEKVRLNLGCGEEEGRRGLRGELKEVRRSVMNLRKERGIEDGEG